MVILFSTVLAVCYKIQYKYQYETTYLGTFEKVDCALYHNSLPSKHYFVESEIEEGDLDADTIKEFKARVNENARTKAAAAKKAPAPNLEEETKNGPVAKIPGFSAVKYQKEAYVSYDAFYHPVTQDDFMKTYINGTLSCFCQDEYDKYGFGTAFRYYRDDGYDQLPPKMLELIDVNEAAKGEEPRKEKICWSYVFQKKFQDTIYWILSIGIIIFNSLFYVFTPPAVQSIGLSLKTDETRMICNGITYCLLVDMIVLPIAIGMNLSEYTTFGKEDSVEDFLNALGIMWGRNTDFGARWYTDTGAILMNTMVIFSIQPIIDFLVEWLLVSIGRCYTRRWVYSKKSNKHKNEAEAMSRYMGLHAGPPYLFY